MTKMEVIMEAVSEEEAEEGPLGSFPDVLSRKDPPRKSAKRKTPKKSILIDKRIKKGQEKTTGPKQISLDDLQYRQKDSDGDEELEPKKTSSPTMPFLEAVNQDFAITQINGDGLACYIRAVVTGTIFVHESQIENIVGAIVDHLAHIGIRSPNQMIDAGGLAAAEVRHALGQLIGLSQTPRVVIVIRDPRGGYTSFTANDGDYEVILLHTGAHFDLLTRK